MTERSWGKGGKTLSPCRPGCHSDPSWILTHTPHCHLQDSRASVSVLVCPLLPSLSPTLLSFFASLYRCLHSLLSLFLSLPPPFPPLIRENQSVSSAANRSSLIRAQESLNYTHKYATCEWCAISALQTNLMNYHTLSPHLSFQIIIHKSIFYAQATIFSFIIIKGTYWHLTTLISCRSASKSPETQHKKMSSCNHEIKKIRHAQILYISQYEPCWPTVSKYNIISPVAVSDVYLVCYIKVCFIHMYCIWMQQEYTRNTAPYV